MADLLSASSILLAILTTLFSIYYPSIREIMDLIPNKYPIDDRDNYNKACIIKKTKVYPLLISSVVITGLFIPESFKLIKDSITNLQTFGFNGVQYDTLIATFIAVTTFTMILTINICILTYKYSHNVNKINPKRQI